MKHSIKVALAAVLLYLLYTKSYKILLTFVLMIALALGKQSQALHIIGSLAVGIVLTIGIVPIANSTLFKGKIQILLLVVLMVLNGLFSVASLIVNQRFGSHLTKASLQGIDIAQIVSYGWGNMFVNIFPVVLLIYYLIKQFRATN